MIHRFAFPAPSPARVAGKAQAMESDMPANYERVSIRGIVRTIEQLDSGLLDPMGELRGTGFLVPTPATVEQLDSGLLDPMGELRGTGSPLVPTDNERASMEATAIDLGINWQSAARIIALALEHGTGEGKAMAREELQRMAALLDSYVAREA